MSTPASRPASAASSSVGTFLGACGAVVLATSVLFALLFPGASSWLTLGPAGCGSLSLVAWGLLSARAIRERYSQRAGLYLVATAGMSLGWLVLLAALNALVWRHAPVLDVSAQGVHSLSDLSRKVARELRSPVRITAFYDAHEPEMARVEEWVDAFQRESDAIEYRRYSPTLDVDSAATYEVRREGPRVFVESHWEEPALRRMARFRLDLSAWNHEETITRALMKVSQAARPRVYFLRGHGEAALDDEGPAGYRQCTQDLLDEGYDVLALSLVDRQEVPEDARAVVIAGPTQALLPPEVQGLGRYLERGGRLAVLLEAGQPHGLASLLASYGIQVNDDLVIDLSPFGSMFGGGPDTAVATEYGSHPITERFSGAATVYPRARSLSINPGTGADVVPLVRTGERAWGETTRDESAALEWNEGEVRGPVTLALAAEALLSSTQPGNDARARAPARLWVVGDASFASNQNLALSANRNLWLNAMAWLSAQEEKIAIRPRTRGSNLIVLSPSQKEGIAFFVLYVLPVALLSIGLGIWLVRRQRS